MTFAVAGMRCLSSTIAGQFDVVIAFDNVIPHLLTDEDLHLAAQKLRAKTRSGEEELASYRLTQFFVVPHGSQWQMRDYITHYRALRRETVTHALSQAGFGEIIWLMPEKSGFYQPIVLATASAL